MSIYDLVLNEAEIKLYSLDYLFDTEATISKLHAFYFAIKTFF